MNVSFKSMSYSFYNKNGVERKLNNPNKNTELCVEYDYNKHRKNPVIKEKYHSINPVNLNKVVEEQIIDEIDVSKGLYVEKLDEGSELSVNHFAPITVTGEDIKDAKIKMEYNTILKFDKVKNTEFALRQASASKFRSKPPLTVNSGENVEVKRVVTTDKFHLNEQDKIQIAGNNLNLVY